MPSTTIRFLILLFVFIYSEFNLGMSQNVPTLIESLENYSKKNNFPGVMLSIVRADTILYSDGIGYANIEDSIRVNNKQLFRQGSISKSFISLALIKILNEKKLSLQTPIKQIDKDIPFINHWFDTAPITVAHLLESSSGFDDFHTHAVYNFTDSIAPETKKWFNLIRILYTLVGLQAVDTPIPIRAMSWLDISLKNFQGYHIKNI